MSIVVVAFGPLLWYWCVLPWLTSHPGPRCPASQLSQQARQGLGYWHSIDPSESMKLQSLRHHGNRLWVKEGLLGEGGLRKLSTFDVDLSEAVRNVTSQRTQAIAMQDAHYRSTPPPPRLAYLPHRIPH